MPTVVFTPAGVRGEVDDGTTVLEAARQLGVDLDSVCGGRGTCGRCQIVPSHGRFPKWALTADPNHLTPWGPLEEGYRGRRPIAEGARLGCGARLVGDMVVDVPPASQIHRQVVRKDIDLDGLTIDPLFALRYVELPEGGEPGLRVRAALAADWSQDVAVPDGVAAAIDPGHHDATVAVRGEAAVAAWPGFVDTAFGAAFDIGSTTVAGHLCDLFSGDVVASAGRMNPQIRFGEDLMSRVSYVMMNPGGDAELTSAIQTALAELLVELTTEAGVEPGRVLDVVLVGNPVMHHLALGLDPTPLGQAPFPLQTDGAVHRRADELGLGLPHASVYVAPCIAGHVGADTAAAVLAEGPHRADEVQLLVDVGTNAEIVLGNRRRLFAASSPTGPAFEGAQISCGQRASVGAVERVRVDPDTFEPRFRVIGSDEWSDDPGFADALPDVGVTGVCGSGIIELVAELVTAGVIDRQGVIDGAAASVNPRIEADGRTFAYRLHGELRLVQADVRAIQLAKAALKAGIDLLFEHAELDTADSVRIAGAFGSHIDPHHAMVLGLIPDGALDAVRATGNSAGTGAVRALLSAAQRAEMEAAVEHVTKIETATEPRFQELFVEALAFPHSPNEGAADAGDGRRRRRRRPTRGEPT